MQVKRYEVSTLREALTKIKSDLGQDAIILSTRRLKEGKDSLFEVVAARDVKSEGRGALGGEDLFISDMGKEDQDLLRGMRDELKELKELMTADVGANNLQHELLDLKEMMESFFDVLGFRKEKQCRDELSLVYGSLIASGVSRPRAYRLVEAMRKDYPPHGSDGGNCRKVTEDCIARAIAFSGKKGAGKRIRAFVGPTGVGKTTTLAKLAAHYALGKKMDIAVITTDTYRIAAAEQLQVYGKIMDIPVAVAAEKESFAKAVRQFAGKDMILVDTPGRSMADEAFMRNLNDLLAADAPVQKDLVLSLTSSRENLLLTAKRFGIFDYDHVIFTKVDECTRTGFLYDVIAQIGKPVSYVTNGQNVPQDIEKASPRKLAKLILGNRIH